MTKTVFFLAVLGLFVSALSVLGDNTASTKELVEQTQSFRNACQDRIGVPTSADAAFKATVESIEVAMRRNKTRVEIHARDQDHKALQAKLESLFSEKVTYFGNAKRVSSGPLLVAKMEYSEVAAPKALVQTLAKQALEKFLSPELFVDKEGKRRDFFLFQGAEYKTPFNEFYFNVVNAGHEYDLRRDLVIFLSEKGDLKGLQAELSKSDVDHFYFTDMKPFDLFVRTHFPRLYDEVLKREHTRTLGLIETVKKVLEAESAVSKVYRAERELTEKVGRGQGTRADIAQLQEYLNLYKEHMRLVDSLPYRRSPTLSNR